MNDTLAARVSHFARRFSVLVFVIGLSCAAVLTALAAPPAPPAASKYAPAADLKLQLSSYLEELDENLESADAFTEVAQGKTFKTAHTVAAIALVLANHDEENDVKPRSAAVIAAAIEIAAAEDNYEAAKSALGKLKLAVESDESADPVAWKQVADLTAIMEQVPVISSKLKRGVRRLERNQEESAALSATLAAIAQNAIHDTSAVEDDEDLPKWYQYCDDMRTAAAEANAAIKQLDEDALKVSLNKLEQSCDNCHDVFQ